MELENKSFVQPFEFCLPGSTPRQPSQVTLLGPILSKLDSQSRRRIPHTGLELIEDTMASTMDLDIDILHGDAITPEIIASAARLFSDHYGIWPNGKRVRISASKLQQEVCAQDACNTYIRASIKGVVAGHVFAWEWAYNNDRICWVTQLVVKHEHRNQGVATSMLRKLKEQGSQDYVGILSSHPFAIMAMLRSFDGGIKDVEQATEHVKAHSAAVMACSPVRYVREAALHSSLHCAFTGSYVDHREPEKALEILRDGEIVWPLGELPQGHEYLVLVRPK